MLYARVKRVPLTAVPAGHDLVVDQGGELVDRHIVVIFGGIYAACYRPTEAAGVAVIYSLFVTMVVHASRFSRSLAYHPERGFPDLANHDES